MNTCLRGIAAALLVLFFPFAALSKDQERPSPVKEHWDMVRKNPGDPSLGPDNAKIVIVEFIDYGCPYCRKMAPDILKLHERNPDVQIVFKEFPILGPASEQAARASLAAARQEGWLAFHASLMASRTGLTIDESIREAALDANLDLDRLYTDMENPEIATIVDRNTRLGELLKVKGTPAIVLGEYTLSKVVPFGIMQDFVRFDRGDFGVEDMIEFGNDLLDQPGGLFGNGYEGVAHYVFERAMLSDPNRWEAHYGLFRVSYREDRFEHLTRAIQLNPKNPELYLRRGHLWDMEETEKAIDDYTTAIRLDPEVSSAYYWRATKHDFNCTNGENFKQKKIEKGAFQAIEDYTEFISLEVTKEPRYQDYEFVWHAYDELAAIWECLGRPDREESVRSVSIKYLESIRSRLPTEQRGYLIRPLLQAHQARALLFLRRGDEDAMMRQIKTAVQAAAGSGETVCNAAAEGAGILIAVMEREDDDQVLWRILEEWGDSGCFHWAGRIRLNEYEDEEGGNAHILEAAERYAAEAVKMEPSNGFYMGVVAEILRKRDDNEGVLKILDLGFDEGFDGLKNYLDEVMYFNFWCLRASALRNTKRYRESRLDFEQCIKEEPKWSHGFKEMAWLLATGPDEVRDGEYAVELARRAVELNGGDGIAKVVLGTALVEAGRTEEAVQAYENAIQDDPELVVHFRWMLRDAGYSGIEENGAYDDRTRDALRECVLAGCQVQ